jgi:uncharacterized membrane protein YedE/YeeE
VNWRAAGCLVAGIGVFLAVTLFGMSLALRGSEGCPPSLQWGPATYQPAGAPAAKPSFAEPGEPVALGSTLIGLTTRVVYGPPGSRASAQADERPQQIALDCGDETFQTYAVSRVLTPSDGASGSIP